MGQSAAGNRKASTEVVGIGSCGVDYFAIVPSLLGADEKINVERTEVHAGGVTGNNLTQVARLGVGAGWLGLPGDDESGRLITKAFTEDGLDLSGIEVVPGEQSSFTWIPVDARGERCIYMIPNVNGKLRPARCAHVSRATFAERNTSIPKLATATPSGRGRMQIAREAGVRVIFDLDVAPSYFASARLGAADELVAALQLVDVLKPCKAAAREITGETGYEKIATKLLSLGPKVVAVSHRTVRSAVGKWWGDKASGGLSGQGCRQHRGGRCVYGRTVVRPATRMGSADCRSVCQCLRGNLLHAHRRASDGLVGRGNKFGARATARTSGCVLACGTAVRQAGAL